MVRSGLASAVLFACSLQSAKASRIKQTVVTRESVSHKEGNNGTFPNLPTLTHVSAHSCPALGAGTLNVACIKAGDMEEKTWFSDIDPYCTVMVSDTTKSEMRGVFSSDLKAKQVTDKLHTRTENDNAKPAWREGFRIHTRCPHLHRGYRVEVIIKQDNWVKDQTLGRAYIPIEDIMRSHQDGDHTYQLQQGEGWVTLRTKWCPLGHYHDECVRDFASGDVAMKGEAVLDCEQSCQGKMLYQMKDKMDYVKQELKAVDAALQREEHADHMEDYHDDMGDEAEEEWGHEARRREDYHDRMEDHWDEVGDEAEEAAKYHRKRASEIAEQLPRVAEEVCGMEIRSTVQPVFRKLIDHFHRHGAKHAWSVVRDTEREMENLKKSMDVHMKLYARLLPDMTSDTIPMACQQAFHSVHW